MAKEFAVLILLANFLALNCQKEELVPELDGNHVIEDGKPSYSFSYGVSDVGTGDIKAVWESKEGDTVKGHYSVLDPGGIMRSVEYSAGPKTGFTAVVNNENIQPPAQEADIRQNMAQPKSMRGFGDFYDISEEIEDDDYNKRKSNRRPYESYKEKDYPHRKRPRYPFDLEPSEYTHSITIKHPHDDLPENEETAHSHIGFSYDPNCKTKTKKESHENRDNLYLNEDYELNKPNKHPNFPPEPFRETYDKYAEPSNFEFEKIRPYSNHKYSKYEELKPSSSMKYNYPSMPDMPQSEKLFYPEVDIPAPRPKKKNRLHKPSISEYTSDDLDDYILVPKKKYKPKRVVEPNDFRYESEEEYDRPSYSSNYNYDDQDERFHPIRGSTPTKEVVRKIVKKRRPPIVNLLDIFDI